MQSFNPSLWNFPDHIPLSPSFPLMLFIFLEMNSKFEVFPVITTGELDAVGDLFVMNMRAIQLLERVDDVRDHLTCFNLIL